MNKIKAVIPALAILGGLSVQAQTITGFGSGDFNLNDPGSSNDFIPTQTLQTFTIAGIDGGPGFFVNLVSPVTLSSNNLPLVLTATLNVANVNGFGIELFDANGASLSYSGLWSSFTVGTATSRTLSFVSNGGFNGTVAAVLLSTGGTGQALNVSFDTLAATPIPEPSTYAALAGLAVLGVVASRRRRVAA